MPFRSRPTDYLGSIMTFTQAEVDIVDELRQFPSGATSESAQGGKICQFGPESETVLETGMTFTVEPGI